METIWRPQRNLDDSLPPHPVIEKFGLEMLAGECEQKQTSVPPVVYLGVEKWSVESILPERRGDGRPVHLHYWRSEDLTIEGYLFARAAWVPHTPLLGGHSFWGLFTEWTQDEDREIVRGCFTQGRQRRV